MEHSIDLNKYEIRTDLVVESIINQDIKIDKISEDDINISKVMITDKEEKLIHKKKGMYVTIEFMDITDFDKREKVGKVFEKELKEMLKYKEIKEDSECLIIGLGNDKSTPDSLGPKTIESILVTKHLFALDKVKSGIRKVSAISPGVMGNTGIETSDIISSIVTAVKPDFLIIIDALAASSIERVNKTIQMTDTGIQPGSGVDNARKEISEDLFHIPVIAIGVPTVVDATTIVNDTLKYLIKHLSYIKNNQKLNKLIVTRHNYLKKIKNEDLSKSEKEEVIGMVGTLSDKDKRSLIKEVLTSIDYNLMVTPKEIDFIIAKLSDVIASSLNNSLHKEVNHY